MTQLFDDKTGLDEQSAKESNEVAEKEDFSTVLINASLDGIAVYDKNLRYTVWSPSMEALTGMKRKDVIGRRASDIFPFLKETGAEEWLMKSLKGEECRIPLLPYDVPETGRHGFIERQNFPLTDEAGKIVAVLSVVRDVTEIQKKFEELTKKNRALETRVQELERKLKK
ncbi:MAG: PAS domain S-box protein [Oligoflexia bacterium]|nr:PAS domain S-box protein [Oligoflexia bacterium]